MQAQTQTTKSYDEQTELCLRHLKDVGFTVLEAYPALVVMGAPPEHTFEAVQWNSRSNITYRVWINGFWREFGFGIDEKIDEAFAFPCSVALTSHKRPPQIQLGLQLGDTVKIAGDQRLWRLEAARNHNVKLVEAKEV